MTPFWLWVAVGGTVLGAVALQVIWSPRSAGARKPPAPAAVEAAMQAAGWSPSEARSIAAQYARGDLR